MKEKLMKIFNYFGLNNQVVKLTEESAELGVACLSDNYLDIAEELADCMVLIKQIQYVYDVSDEEIEAIMKEKVDRTLTRIKKGYYEDHR